MNARVTDKEEDTTTFEEPEVYNFVAGQTGIEEAPAAECGKDNKDSKIKGIKKDAPCEKQLKDI